MNVICFPMLPKYLAVKKYEELILPNLSDFDNIQKAVQFDPDSSEVNWLPVGEKISMSLIEDFRNTVYDSVLNQFPLYKSTRTVNNREFDIFMMKTVGPALEKLELTTTMAAVPDMWYYMNIVLFPDLVVLRWKDSRAKSVINHERFFANTRNYLGLLWTRYYFFVDKDDSSNPWWMIENLTEDDYVGMLERTKSRGELALTREMGRVIAKMRLDNKSGRRVFAIDEIIREFMKNVRIATNCYDTTFLAKNPTDMRDLLTSELNRARNTVTKSI